MKLKLITAVAAVAFCTQALAVNNEIVDLAREVGDLREKVEQVEMKSASFKSQADRHIEEAVAKKLAEYAAKSGDDTEEIQAIVKGVMVSQTEIVASAVTSALSPIEARLAALETLTKQKDLDQAALTVLVPVSSADKAQELYKRLPTMGYSQRLLVPRDNSWSLHVGPFPDQQAAIVAAEAIADASGQRTYVIDANGSVIP